MYIVVSSIGYGTITKGIKTPVEDLGPDAEESPPQRQTIATCQTPEDTNTTEKKYQWSHSGVWLTFAAPPKRYSRICANYKPQHGAILYIELKATHREVESLFL
ncbi:hypothetical protein AVEN_173359-1 [Araneus ventricosus]|uniref:Uncharacterized protein n=1 Tax=Araneus ventricosus TaxID=182803 RepID=A0A4Y2IBF8_ARAVE|nr:hypothetical protein AVEN_173359-1 [Araneus ventricosus]